jgi:hypothetical protein
MFLEKFCGEKIGECAFTDTKVQPSLFEKKDKKAGFTTCRLRGKQYP